MGKRRVRGRGFGDWWDKAKSAGEKVGTALAPAAGRIIDKRLANLEKTLSGDGRRRKKKCMCGGGFFDSLGDVLHGTTGALNKGLRGALGGSRRKRCSGKGIRRRR